MCLEVRALGVRLAASSERAGVCGRALPRPGSSPALRLGLEQVERRGRRSEKRARGTRLHHTEAIIEHTPVCARSRVGQRYLLMLVLLRQRRVARVVAVLRESCAADLRVTTRLVVRAERRRHVPRCLRRDGEPRLVKGHCAWHVALLFDPLAALWHHAQHGTVAVRAWLNFDTLDEVLPRERSRVHHEPALNPDTAAGAGAGAGCAGCAHAVRVVRFGVQQFRHKAVGVWWWRWHVRAPCLVHVAVLHCWIIVRRSHHALRTGRVGQNKLQIQVVTQILFVLSGTAHIHTRYSAQKRLLHFSNPPLQTKKDAFSVKMIFH